MQHPSHKTRLSDSSVFDEVCVNCGATDNQPLKMEAPCPNAPESSKPVSIFPAKPYYWIVVAVDFDINSAPVLRFSEDLGKINFDVYDILDDRSITFDPEVPLTPGLWKFVLEPWVEKSWGDGHDSGYRIVGSQLLVAGSCQWKPASCPGPKPNLPCGRMT